MENEVKVSQLSSADEVYDTDVVMIVQNGFNKKAEVKNIQRKHSYKYVVDSDSTSGAQITLPAYYKVGISVLDVFLNGEKLIRTTSSDTVGANGHYYEDGDVGDISNTIHITSDWNLDAGDVLEFIVKGVYSV